MRATLHAAATLNKELCYDSYIGAIHKYMFATEMLRIFRVQYSYCWSVVTELQGVHVSVQHPIRRSGIQLPLPRTAPPPAVTALVRLGSAAGTQNCSATVQSCGYD